MNPVHKTANVMPGQSDLILVAFGKSGVIGVFSTEEPIVARRGCRVVIESNRGIEIGSIVRPATLTQARVFGAAASGRILRLATRDDERQALNLTERAHAIFEAGRASSRLAGLNLEILDVDLFLDGRTSILQFVGDDVGTEELCLSLGQQFGLTVRCENLAVGEMSAPESAGCEKPDCGKGAGGCTSCSTGTGCSSCGTEKVDLKPYFAHLRVSMETRGRIPLA